MLQDLDSARLVRTDGRADAHAASVTAHARRDDPVEDLIPIARGVLERNARLNLNVRRGLALLAVAATALAIAYTWRHGDTIVTSLGADASGRLVGERVLALTLPVLLLVGLGVLATIAGLVLHSRGSDELAEAIDAIGRLRRESEVPVSARGLIHTFEEKLACTRRAFTLLLWLGRSLFVVSLGLFSLAVLDSLLHRVDLTTVALGGGSLLSALLGTARLIPRNITCHLADVIQVQTTVTGCDREIKLLETYAYRVLQGKSDAPSAEVAVATIQRRMDHVVQAAVMRIEGYADPSDPKGAASSRAALETAFAAPAPDAAAGE